MSADPTGMQVLQSYGMQAVANVALTSPVDFTIRPIEPEAWSWTFSIYAFLIGGDICRVGSSKGLLGDRMRSWSRDLSTRLARMDDPAKLATSAREAALWRERLERHGSGVVMARRGTIVQTPVGEISAYLDEESVLIGRHRPPLNNSTHR